MQPRHLKHQTGAKFLSAPAGNDVGQQRFQHWLGKVTELLAVRKVDGVYPHFPDAVAFLASNKASYINGQDLVIDGGLVAAIPA